MGGDELLDVILTSLPLQYCIQSDDMSLPPLVHCLQAQESAETELPECGKLDLKPIAGLTWLSRWCLEPFHRPSGEHVTGHA